MKTFGLIAIVSAVNIRTLDTSGLKRRHPLKRLVKLNSFVNEWLSDNFPEDPKLVSHWATKFEKNNNRFLERWEQCKLEKFSNRKRRSEDYDDYDDEECEPDDASCLLRYDRTVPLRGIHQITKGFENWAKKYVSDCRLQPEVQKKRARLWREVLKTKYAEELGLNV